MNKQQLCTTAILLFAFVPLGLCHMNCNIGGCKILFQSTLFNLLSDGLESMCRVIGEVLKCVTDCHKTFFPQFISTNSTIYFLNTVCNGDFMYGITDENWKCIRQHFNRLLACVATSSSLEFPKNKRDNTKLLSCRKILSVLNCPQDVLYNQCEDNVVEIVNEAFQQGLKPLLETSCFKIASNKASNIDVQPSLDTEYNEVAVCMDNYGDLSRNCFDEYLEKAAHSELNSCSDDTETICNKPSSSIPCSPLSSVSNFYSTIFSYGKQKCKKESPSTNVYKLKPHTTPSITEAIDKETREKIMEDTSPFIKEEISNLFHTSTMETITHPPLELNKATSLVENSYSTINTTTDNTNMFYDNFMYSSSSTILPDNMNEESVLSDAPQNNSINISNEYHTSHGTRFVSFIYIYFVAVAILI